MVVEKLRGTTRAIELMAHKDIIKYITPEEKKISIEGKKFTKKKPVTNI